jgi:hypothetical protein
MCNGSSLRNVKEWYKKELKENIKKVNRHMFLKEL